MLQFFEIIILQFVQWFYTLPIFVGLITLGIVGAVLIAIQFMKRGATILPGVAGIFVLVAEVAHLIDRETVVEMTNAAFRALETPSIPRPIPVVEFIFHIFVAPAEYRFVFEEFLFIFIVGYLGSVLWHGFKEYKKTGVLLGEFSLAAFLEKHAARPERSDSNELGSGDLANTEQISKWTKPSGQPGDTMLDVTDLRGSDGISFKNTKLVIKREERNRHMLIIAKTGSGKTTKLILPVLYNDCLCKNRSTIVIDSKPEMWPKLANFTREHNPDKNIMLFNPLDTVRSLSWNILGKIENDTDAKLIANTVIMATDQPNSKSDSPFFRNNALNILNAVMVGLLHDPEDQLSMPRIHELVQSGMKPLCDWLEQHPHALRNSRTFIELARSGSQNADTIMSELSMRLGAWDLSAIRATTWHNEIDIEKLIQEPSLFVIEFRESELEMLRPMANVIVVEILRFLTKRAESEPGLTLPRPVGLVIDEFASALGRLPDIHVKLNTLRSRNVSIVGAIQSIAQVKAAYGDDADSVLAGFSTKIFMPSLDLQDAEWASKETGQMTIRFKTASTGSNRKMIEWFASKNDSTQEQVQQRAVLTPDEIGRPADNICTLFMPNAPAFQGHLVPFYKIPEMLERINASEKAPQLALRDAPIEVDEKLPEAGSVTSAKDKAAGAGGLPAGITDTKGWDDAKLRKTLDETKDKLEWKNTTGSAKKWWEAFENENQHRLALVLRLAEELANRKATITEFFLAYVYSNTDNIQANLHYLDYTRLKKEEEKKKKEAAAKAKAEAQKGSTAAA
ncbi:type IV secretory system conjugative DNA transfer family protein [Oligoflexia bacterium]|nr:type IV secretory system conjugative DNA transfer family protein [Oligoflexia bacterium]